MTAEAPKAYTSQELNQLVKEADIGGRDPGGRVGAFSMSVAMRSP